MKNAKTNLLLIALSSLTVLALAGSSLGTLAWYAYSVRVTSEFSGTAVNETEQLQIGLLWNGVSDEKRDAYSTGDYKDMTFEAVAPSSPNYYWFMLPGKGFTAKEVSAYLEENGYTTNKLQPVTTREYKTGDSLYNNNNTPADPSDDKIELYQAPSATYVITDTYATKNQYVYLPFVFRIISYSSGTVRSYAKKGNIWLTDVTTAVSGSKIANRSLRIHIDNLASPSLHVTDAETSFNLNPEAKHVEGKDFNYVAGLLDLKKSGGYYDTDALNRELIYGDITISDRSTLYNTSVMKNYVDEFDATTDLEDSNINGVTEDEVYRGDSETPEDSNTTFWARHRAGTSGFTSFYDKDGNDIRKKAEYMCLSQIKPTKNSAGDWEGGSPITTTADNDTGIGRCDMYIYLEGWDHSIVDSQIDTAFSLGLQFEINRV